MSSGGAGLTRGCLRRILTVILAAPLFFSGPGCRREPAPGTLFKHVILFIGDGMGLPSEVAASRYLYGEDRGLAWHSFAGKSYVTTWNVSAYNRNARREEKEMFLPEAFDPALGYDVLTEGFEPFLYMDPASDENQERRVRSAAESASTATALSTGYKTTDGNVAWLPGDPPDGRMTTILEEFRDVKGGSVGVVSTVPFNHATPAAFVSHNVSRSNYYTGYKGYREEGLADEIILSVKPDVVIGGGHPAHGNPSFDEGKPYISEGLMEALRTSEEYVFVERRKDVAGSAALAAGVEEALGKGKKLFGLFGGSDGSFETPLPNDSPGSPEIVRVTVENPTFVDAVVAALRVLSRNPQGFFLMAEEGDVDWANHDSDFRRMIGAMSELEGAVQAAAAFIDRPGDGIDWSNTIVIVTADHATGRLRLNPRKPLGAGDLPEQRVREDDDEKARRLMGLKKSEFVAPFVYPGGEISYGTSGHTNELVTFSVSAPAAGIFLKYSGRWYPGPIMDNTQINAGLREALGLPPVRSGGPDSEDR